MLANRLKELRSKANLTQRELAKKLNISNGTIAMYETGKRSPDYETLQQIATFFDVSIDYLLGNKYDFDMVMKKGSKEYFIEAKTIDQQLNEVLEKLESSGSALMFKGKPMNDATKIALLNSLKNVMNMAEQMNELEKIQNKSSENKKN